MATNFPGSTDSFTNPTSSTPMDTAGGLQHDVQHTNANDAIAAIEAFLLGLAYSSTGITLRAAANQDGIRFRGRAGGTGGFYLEVVPAVLAASVTHTAQAKTGTIALRDAGTTDGIFDWSNPNAITTTATALSGRVNVISGTAADYTVTMPASPATGSAVAFVVKDWSVANKQYTLDAGVGVLIAGRTRNLVLMHTNVVILHYDGAAWQPIVLSLDTPWVTAASGTTITATSVNPTTGTVPLNTIRWRRLGDSCIAHMAFRQSAAGSNGTGAYLYTLPYTADTAKIPLFDTSLLNAAIGTASAESASGAGGGAACLYSSTQVQLYTSAGASSGANGSSQNALGNASCSFGYHVQYPVVNW